MTHFVFTLSVCFCLDILLSYFFPLNWKYKIKSIANQEQSLQQKRSKPAGALFEKQLVTDSVANNSRKESLRVSFKSAVFGLPAWQCTNRPVEYYQTSANICNHVFFAHVFITIIYWNKRIGNHNIIAFVLKGNIKCLWWILQSGVQRIAQGDPFFHLSSTSSKSLCMPPNICTGSCGIVIFILLSYKPYDIY